jgi:hypothetical protein
MRVPINREELIKRLMFALDKRYAHNIVIISVETASALLKELDAPTRPTVDA